MSEIINALHIIQNNPERDHVLAVVIETQGSVPQCKGAAMLVHSDEVISGTIGGGRMEYQCIIKCKEMQNSNEAEIFEFQMNEPYDRDGGPICGGMIKIFITNMIKAHDSALDDAARYFKQSSNFYFAININKDSKEYGKILCSVKELSGAQNLFITHIQAKNKVFIVGAGHCGLAIAELANWLDLDTYLIDDRKIKSTDGLSYFHNSNFKNFLSANTINDNTAIVLVNKGHKEDAEALELCINSPAKYIGMIGSKRKIELIKIDFLEKKITTKDIWNKVYAPIGLDIDAFEVKEIALSVISEVIAVLNDKKPTMSHRFH